MIRASLVIATLLGGAAMADAHNPRPQFPKGSPEWPNMDDSIRRGLDFLKRAQIKEGTYRGAWGQPSQSAAVTAVCVMAFCAAGEVPGEGPYGRTIEDGIHFIVRVQQPNGLIATVGSHEMYHHGMASLMLAEVAAMVKDDPTSPDPIRREFSRKVRDALQKAVTVIVRSQKTSGVHSGGWRYRMNSQDADMSITAWQFLALRAARNLGCDVPHEVLERSILYVRRSWDSRSGGYKYNATGGGRVSTALTGAASLGMFLLTDDYMGSEQQKAAARYLLDQARRGFPQRMNFGYGIYYCAQACFQAGGEVWDTCRRELHKLLRPMQRPDGSFALPDNTGAAYCTAMAILSVTVEYRYLPIYQRPDDDEVPELIRPSAPRNP